MRADFVKEPRGAIFRRLVQALAELSAEIVLIARGPLTRGAKALVSQLEPHVIERRRTSSWPGTELLNGEATMIRLRATAEVAERLSSAAEGLYGWTHPALPEDLAFLRQDGSVLLGSIAHERDAFLQLTDAEHRALLHAVPELPDLIRVTG